MIEQPQIEAIVKAHIEQFEAGYDWKAVAVDTCYRLIQDNILSGVSVDGSQKQSEALVDEINTFLQDFAQEWDYSKQYAALPPEQFVDERSSVRIIQVVEARIRRFESEYGWKNEMVRACIAGARMFVFHGVSSQSEENTDERLSMVTERLNDKIEELVKGLSEYEDDPPQFIVSDLLSKVSDKEEVAVKQQDNDFKI